MCYRYRLSLNCIAIFIQISGQFPVGSETAQFPVALEVHKFQASCGHVINLEYCVALLVCVSEGVSRIVHARLGLVDLYNNRTTTG